MAWKPPSWAAPAAVFAAVFALCFGLAAPHSGTPRDAPSAGIVWSHGHDGATRNAEEHWLKHGRDFPEFHDAAEYERGALAFLHHPPPGTLVKHRFNGDTLLYDPATNTFAVEDSDGEPRTFFRPNNGRRYWQRQ